VVGGEAAGTYRARDLMRRMATAAWECGDPGVQFDTTINQWHTCPESGRISASNPCSEYMFLDDSACNLASLNLRAFQDPETGDLDVESFRHAVQITVLAMEILVDSASYPTARIADHSRQFRPLGLGYANLGALLMSGGLPYDSDAGRALAAAITALMSGEAYRMSALIARDAGGAFDGYPENSQPFLDVMCRHLDACDELVRRDVQRAWSSLLQAARNSWGEAIAMGQLTGFRNAQATVLAPTGTIAFLMDCDTTGIEPDIAIVKRKELVGGGEMRIVNGTVPEALRRLGYDPAQVDAIVRHADARGTVEGAPGLRDEHLPAFDCALRAGSGTRSISYMGHIKMMAAVQPFLSGAISKTVNLPADCTVVDVEDAYIQAWRLGLKSIAVYRDGCKRTQPLSAGAGPDPAAPGPNLGSGADPIGGGTVAAADDPDYRLSAEERGAVDAIRALRRRPAGPPVANRHKLPTERPSRTHKFSVGGHEGYVTVGMYQDGSPGEIFVRMAKEGSSIAGLMDSFATAISLSLQHGVPLQLLVDKFRGTRFEPSGFTGNQEIPIATSIMDYLFRWLAVRFPATEDRGPVAAGGPATSAAPAPADDSAIFSGAQISGHRSMPRNDGPLPENVDVAEDRRVFASLSDQADRAFLLEEIRSPRSDRQNSRRVDSDAPPCPDCGTLMVRSGACRRCPNCGSTSGCS
jgi:ribonucleoside-diphosphate reductase alpha chain